MNQRECGCKKSCVGAPSHHHFKGVMAAIGCLPQLSVFKPRLLLFNLLLQSGLAQWQIHMIRINDRKNVQLMLCLHCLMIFILSGQLDLHEGSNDVELMSKVIANVKGIHMHLGSRSNLQNRFIRKMTATVQNRSSSPLDIPHPQKSCRTWCSARKRCSSAA